MKRCLCAVLLVVMVLLFAACGRSAASNAPTPPPVTTSSRYSAPVKVNETIANAQTVDANTTPKSTQSAQPSSTAAPIDTPATGDFPVMYLAGVLGLIFLCSAGLLMLRKI